MISFVELREPIRPPGGGMFARSFIYGQDGVKIETTTDSPGGQLCIELSVGGSSRLVPWHMVASLSYG